MSESSRKRAALLVVGAVLSAAGVIRAWPQPFHPTESVQAGQSGQSGLEVASPMASEVASEVRLPLESTVSTPVAQGPPRATKHRVRSAVVSARPADRAAGPKRVPAAADRLAHSSERPTAVEADTAASPLATRELAIDLTLFTLPSQPSDLAPAQPSGAVSRALNAASRGVATGLRATASALRSTF